MLNCNVIIIKVQHGLPEKERGEDIHLTVFEDRSRIEWDRITIANE